MKYILLAVAAAFFLIAIYESLFYGMAKSYWLFMLSAFVFFLAKLLYSKPKPVDEIKKK